jgi:hypothetical protein
MHVSSDTQWRAAEIDDETGDLRFRQLLGCMNGGTPGWRLVRRLDHERSGAVTAERADQAVRIVTGEPEIAGHRPPGLALGQQPVDERTDRTVRVPLTDHRQRQTEDRCAEGEPSEGVVGVGGAKRPRASVIVATQTSFSQTANSSGTRRPPSRW